MKKILLFIIILVGLIGVIAAEKQTDLQKTNLFGKVKSVTTTSYDAKECFGEWIQGEPLSIEFSAYDSKGNLTEEAHQWFNYYRSFGTRGFYTYNDKVKELKKPTTMLTVR